MKKAPEKEQNKPIRKNLMDEKDITYHTSSKFSVQIIFYEMCFFV